MCEKLLSQHLGVFGLKMRIIKNGIYRPLLSSTFFMKYLSGCKPMFSDVTRAKQNRGISDERSKGAYQTNETEIHQSCLTFVKRKLVCVT